MTDHIKIGSVENRSVDTLKPFEKNAKLHPEEQINALVSSIRQIGFRNKPIEITADGTIVNGHGRWMAAKKVGMSHVPVVVLDDMTEDEIRQYRITDNKLAQTGFDNELLKEEVFYLHTEADMDMSEFFSEKEFDFLATDLGDMDFDAITDDLAGDVEELGAATQNSIDKESATEVPISRVLGYSKVTEAEQRKIALLQAHAEGTTGLKAGAALSLFAKDHMGL